MSDVLDKKIEKVLDSADRMFIATSVGGNSSGASVFFSRDGEDLVFFTFHPTRKAEQIRLNPRVHVVIWPKGQEGIEGLQIDGECYKIKNEDEKEKAYNLVLETTDAFKEFMEDDFLIKNDVVGYYRVKPTTIKYVNFFQEEKFEWKTIPSNKTSAVKMALKLGLKRIGLWLRTIRAPFLTATFAPIFIGAAVAWSDLKESGLDSAWSWKMFWLVLAGASLAQVATNSSNDYFDHTSNADEINKVASPFNGGSRVIQVGLMTPGQVLITALMSIAGTVAIGLYLNQQVSGGYFANTPILWSGVLGTFLALGYTGDPVRLGYKGFGEIAIALGFGPVMVMGAHYVLTSPIHNNILTNWNWVEALVASLPIAILVMLIVWINQFQDAPSDAAVGKNTWVVRTAEQGEWMKLEKPMRLYKQFMIEAFIAVASIGVLSFFTNIGTAYAFIALAPLALVWKAFKMADEWMIKWNSPEADRQKVPYELLLVNVSTIGIHFLTGLLLATAYIL
ncbi:MAG: hypothetical protein CL496_01210 [Actinobacteria bacterium]|nr:hypothetical protein [Actinomycetota bacterium]